MVRRLGAPVSDRHAARRAATTYCPRVRWRGRWPSRHPCVSKYVFARRRRAVPVRDRRSKPSPSSGEAAFTQQLAGGDGAGVGVVVTINSRCVAARGPTVPENMNIWHRSPFVMRQIWANNSRSCAQSRILRRASESAEGCGGARPPAPAARAGGAARPAPGGGAVGGHHADAGSVRERLLRARVGQARLHRGVGDGPHGRRDDRDHFRPMRPHRSRRSAIHAQHYVAHLHEFELEHPADGDHRGRCGHQRHLLFPSTHGDQYGFGLQRGHALRGFLGTCGDAENGFPTVPHSLFRSV